MYVRQRVCLLPGLNRNVKEDLCLEQVLAWISQWRRRRLSQRSFIQPLPNPRLCLYSKWGSWGSPNQALAQCPQELPQKPPAAAVLPAVLPYSLGSLTKSKVFSKELTNQDQTENCSLQQLNWRPNDRTGELTEQYWRWFSNSKPLLLDCPNFIGSLLCCVLDPPAVCSSVSAYPVCWRTIILCLIEFSLWK